MAEFEVKIYKLTIEEHPNADALELARVGNYRAIVQKGAYQTGDLGAYIPEGAIVPDWLLERLNLTGRLAGKQKNRVKAIKLRGVLSQGLIVPLVGKQSDFPDACTWLISNQTATMGVGVGDDVTEFLGITKYEPEIPSSMSGQVMSAHGMTLKYDIENLKKYPNVLEDGEEVVLTEKIHGTWCCFGYHPELREQHIVTSKGLSARGLIFKMIPENENNLYIRALSATAPVEDGTGGTVLDRAMQFVNERYAFEDMSVAFYILGEVFGKGVQDLHYGQDKPAFRIFDVYIGDPRTGRYLGFEEKREFAEAVGVPLVPVLYVGPYNEEVVEEYTNGRETVSAQLEEDVHPSYNGFNVREGVVITPAVERRDDELGRVILKSVSEAYLLRKGGTEYN